MKASVTINIKGHPSATEKRLVEAAIACFEKFGIEKTFIEDIAKEAGVSRQTAYRLLGNRTELLERIVQERISAMKGKVQPLLLRCDSFEEAFVRGSVKVMNVTLRDKVFMSILSSLGDKGLERYLLNSIAVKDQITATWGGVIDQAIENGELRKSLTKTDAVAYINMSLCVLLLKDEFSPKAQEQFLRTFMVPGLIEPEATRHQK